MSLQLKCLIPLTGIACGLTAAALHVLDPGVAATGALSLASLVSAFKEHCAKHGMDEPSLTKKMQTAVIRDWDDADQTQEERDIICDADAAMSQHLADCMLDRRALADSSVSTKPYPQYAAELVVDRLADFDTMFAAPANPNATVPLARRFALSVIVRALETARDDQDYAALLTVDLLLAGNTAHAVTHEKLDQVLALLGKTNLSDESIRQAVARFIDFKPVANNSEIIEAIHVFERKLAALKAQLATFSGQDNYVQSLKVKAEQALDASDLDTARRLFAEAVAAAQAKVIEPVRTAAQLKSALASAHLLALDWEAADKAWAEAETMLAPFDQDSAEKIGWEASIALRVFGETFGSAAVLDTAVARWKKLFDTAVSREEWAKAAVRASNLGNALIRRGGQLEGGAGVDLLVRAVEIYRVTGRVFSREADPKLWADIQSNFGTAMVELAERTGGDGQQVLLRQGVQILKAAQRVHKMMNLPKAWTQDQINLGHAMRLLAERTPGDPGIRLLRKAVTNFRAALRLYANEAPTDNWAAAQCGLGTALLAQGVRLSGAGGKRRLEEAIAAIEAGLTFYSYDASPVPWAKQQSNLGCALLRCGELAPSRARAELFIRAVASFDLALTIFTPENSSQFYAVAVHNRACALTLIAERRGCG